jgi:hypothetical protein
MAEHQQSTTASILTTASVTGVLLHVLFFKNVEVDRHPVRIATAFASTSFLLTIALSSISEEYASLPWALAIAFMALLSLISSLCTSILVYRAFLHPLKKFPGPFNARLSKFWTLKKVIGTKIRWYQVLDQLHEKYGDYVRTGESVFS